MINTTLQQNTTTTSIFGYPTTTTSTYSDTKYLGFQIICNFFAALLILLSITLYCYRQKLTSKGWVSKCSIIMNVLGGILFIVLFNGTTIYEYIKIKEGLWPGYSVLGLVFLLVPLTFFIGGFIALSVDYTLKYIQHHKEKRRIFRVLPRRLVNTV